MEEIYNGEGRKAQANIENSIEYMVKSLEIEIADRDAEIMINVLIMQGLEVETSKSLVADYPKEYYEPAEHAVKNTKYLIEFLYGRIEHLRKMMNVLLKNGSRPLSEIGTKTVLEAIDMAEPSEKKTYEDLKNNISENLMAMVRPWLTIR